MHDNLKHKRRYNLLNNLIHDISNVCTVYPMPLRAAPKAIRQFPVQHVPHVPPPIRFTNFRSVCTCCYCSHAADTVQISTLHPSNATCSISEPSLQQWTATPDPPKPLTAPCSTSIGGAPFLCVRCKISDLVSSQKMERRYIPHTQRCHKRDEASR